MKYSMIIGTLNRSNYLNKCLISLSNQKYRDFEVIIVDQSENNETMNLINNFQDLYIKYYKVHDKGLSKARNVAIKNATGDYFCLIDDDAYYRDDYLECIDREITKTSNKKIIYSGYLWNQIGECEFVNYSALQDNKKLNIMEILRYAPSPALVFPITVVESVGLFDECFGVGAKYGACEETDYVIRCREKGYEVVYKSCVYAYHPMVLERENTICLTTPEKHFNYSKGKGALFKKHLFQQKNYELVLPALNNFMKKLIKYIFHIGKREDVKAQLKGFICGFKEYDVH